jgi:hypothetical protein
MKHVLKVVFGKEQVAKIYNNEKLTGEELKLNFKEYHFNSEAEKQAFIYGLNQAIGWMEICIPEVEISKGVSSNYTT